MSKLLILLPLFVLASLTTAGEWYGDLTYSGSDGGLQSSPIVEVDNKDSGFQITVGYDVNKHFAVELGYVDYGQQSLSRNIFTIAGLSPNITFNPFATTPLPPTLAAGTVFVNPNALSIAPFPSQGFVTETTGLRLASVGKLSLNRSFDLNFHAGAVVPRYKTTQELLVPDFGAATSMFIPTRIETHTEVSNEPELLVGLGVHWRVNPSMGLKVFWEKLEDLGNEETVEQDMDTYNLALRYQF